MFFLFSMFTLISCQEVSDYRNYFDSLQRREQIPLNQINRRFNSNVNYRRTKEIREKYITEKRQLMPLGTIRDEDKSAMFEHSSAYYDRNQNDIVDRRGDEWIYKKREEIWDRRKAYAKNKEDELNRQRINTMNKEQDEILDRRFEQSERELKRLDEAQDKLEELHNQLSWITINTDEGVGIEI